MTLDVASDLSASQAFDSEGKLLEDATMQALEVFCTCWFTFEVRRSELCCFTDEKPKMGEAEC